MSILMGTLRSIGSPWRQRLLLAALSGCLFATCGILGLTAVPPQAAAADPAVKFMAQVGRELIAATRNGSPTLMASVIERYGDVSYIGLYSLGSYRNRLSAEEKTAYLGGMVRFISRYASSQAPKYPVARVEWENQSFRGASGLMVDSKVVLQDGSVYEVRWLLSQRGGTYKVRDAMVLGLWMTPFLRQLFENYIAENGGNPRALVAALSR
jgi:phospholipid transport system substrate-binding protein